MAALHIDPEDLKKKVEQEAKQAKETKKENQEVLTNSTTLLTNSTQSLTLANVAIQMNVSNKSIEKTEPANN